MHIKIILLALIFLLTSHIPTYSVSPSFLKHGFKHCTESYESNKINGDEKANNQGFYDWCKSKCLLRGKKDFDVFQNASAVDNWCTSHASTKEKIIAPHSQEQVIVFQVSAQDIMVPKKKIDHDAVLPTESLPAHDLTDEVKDAFTILGMPVNATFKEVNDRFGILDRQFYLSHNQKKRAYTKYAYQIIEAAFSDKISGTTF